MNNDELNFFGCIGLIAGAAALTFVSAILNGWALATLWAWFIIPVFEQAPQLSLVQAIGIGMIVEFITSKPKFDQESRDKDSIQLIVNAFGRVVLNPCMTVLLGWILFTWFI